MSQKRFIKILVIGLITVIITICGYFISTRTNQQQESNNQNVIPSVTIISPKEGEFLQVGKTYDIIWNSQNVNKLYFYIVKQGESDVAFIIGDNIQASTGKYSWTIPVDNEDINSGGQFKIGVIADDNNSSIAESDWFSIIQQEDKEPSQSNVESPIKVYTPVNGEEAKSPLTIEGEAKGPWFFEATFPVKIYDANNNLLGTGIAQAKDDWMQSDFVPFEAKVSFDNPGAGNGVIVLEKANPSGLAKNAEELRINIKFKN